MMDNVSRTSAFEQKHMQSYRLLHVVEQNKFVPILKNWLKRLSRL